MWQTIEALQRTGREVVSIGHLSRSAARTNFPQLFRRNTAVLVKRVLLGLLLLVIALVAIILVVSVVVFYN